MNINMSKAIYVDGNGKQFNLDNFFICGRKIRYVHIPEQVFTIKNYFLKISENNLN